WPLRDRCPCDVAIDLRDRVFLLPPDARPSGFACFRRLPPRDAGHVRRDTSLWDAAKQHFALFQVTVRHIRDRRLCRLHIIVRHRVLLLRPDARSSGLASFRRLSARDAGHAHRDTCLWNAVEQLASRLHELGPPRVKTKISAPASKQSAGRRRSHVTARQRRRTMRQKLQSAVSAWVRSAAARDPDPALRRPRARCVARAWHQAWSKPAYLSWRREQSSGVPAPMRQSDPIASGDAADRLLAAFE